VNSVDGHFISVLSEFCLPFSSGCVCNKERERESGESKKSRNEKHPTAMCHPVLQSSARLPQFFSCARTRLCPVCTPRLPGRTSRRWSHTTIANMHFLTPRKKTLLWERSVSRRPRRRRGSISGLWRPHEVPKKQLSRSLSGVVL